MLKAAMLSYFRYFIPTDFIAQTVMLSPLTRHRMIAIEPEERFEQGRGFDRAFMVGVVGVGHRLQLAAVAGVRTYLAAQTSLASH